MRLFIASILMLFSPQKCFEFYVKIFFPDEYILPNFHESSCHLRRKIRFAAKNNFIFFSVVIFIVWSVWRFEFSIFNATKAASAYIALTVTIGRGGWSLQTWNGRSLSERIDQLIYKMAQYTNVLILLGTIYYPSK